MCIPAPYLAKLLRKAIMKRSYLEKFFRTTKYLKKYKKNSNFCSRLYKKKRKKHFDTLNVKKITKKKLFRKKSKLLLL